jgi:hypothetical protein
MGNRLVELRGKEGEEKKEANAVEGWREMVKVWTGALATRGGCDWRGVGE